MRLVRTSKTSALYELRSISSGQIHSRRARQGTREMAAPKTRNGVCEKCQGKGWYYINPTDEVDDFERMECDCGARVREEDAELAVV